MAKAKDMKIKGVAPVEVQEFNTNNGWGFGGGIGKKYLYPNGYSIRKGRAYYRHLPSHAYTTYCEPSGRHISKEKFEEAF